MAFPESSTLIVLCGKTGSGKTLLLKHLEESGYPVINLEKIASHRGFAFGGLLLSCFPHFLKSSSESLDFTGLSFENECCEAIFTHVFTKIKE